MLVLIAIRPLNYCNRTHSCILYDTSNSFRTHDASSIAEKPETLDFGTFETEAKRFIFYLCTDLFEFGWNKRLNIESIYFHEYVWIYSVSSTIDDFQWRFCPKVESVCRAWNATCGPEGRLHLLRPDRWV